MTISAQSLAAASAKLSYPGRVPIFYLPSSQGGQSGSASTRSKYNLALVFLEDGAAGEAYLRAISALYPDILDMAARVIAMLPLPLDAVRDVAQRLALPFTVLADEGGVVTRRLLDEKAHAALCVADRYGIVSYLHHSANTGDLPPAQSLLDRLEYMQLQCPECTDGADSGWLQSDEGRLTKDD